MNQWEKLLERMQNNPKTARFEELDKVLSRSGFQRRQSPKGTGHYVYTRGATLLTIPYHRPYVREIYVKKAIEFLKGDGDA